MLALLTFMPVTSIHQIFLLAYRPAEACRVPEDEPVPLCVLEHRSLWRPAHPQRALLVLPVTVGVLSILDLQLGAEQAAHLS